MLLLNPEQEWDSAARQMGELESGMRRQGLQRGNLAALLWSLQGIPESTVQGPQRADLTGLGLCRELAGPVPQCGPQQAWAVLLSLSCSLGSVWLSPFPAVGRTAVLAPTDAGGSEDPLCIPVPSVPSPKMNQ